MDRGHHRYRPAKAFRAPNLHARYQEASVWPSSASEVRNPFVQPSVFHGASACSDAAAVRVFEASRPSTTPQNRMRVARIAGHSPSTTSHECVPLSCDEQGGLRKPRLAPSRPTAPLPGTVGCLWRWNARWPASKISPQSAILPARSILRRRRPISAARCQESLRLPSTATWRRIASSRAR
jgi:hypothetical protein